MKKIALLSGLAALCLASPVAAAAADSDMKDVMQACRKEARVQGLKAQTHEMREAVMACVVKKKPGTESTMRCRMEAMDKGLKPKSDEMKAYVKDCKNHG